MSIDPLTEELLSMKDAAALLPKRRGGGESLAHFPLALEHARREGCPLGNGPCRLLRLHDASRPPPLHRGPDRRRRRDRAASPGPEHALAASGS